MKTFLLLATSSVIGAGMLPSLPAKIILSALVLMSALIATSGHAPVGYQDENGFHPAHPLRTKRRRAQRKLWRTRRKLFVSWLFSDSQGPAKA